jgi:ribosomal protein S18 acetylase RimI-like enzyme
VEELRVISADDLERVAAPGWRAPEEERLGAWLLRSAEGFTGRANSALAIGDPGMRADEAVDRVRLWYQNRGLPAMISLPYPLGEPHRNPLDALLESRGWTVRAGAATVMVARVDVVTADAGTVEAGTVEAATAEAGTAEAGTAEAGTGAEIDAYPDEAWLGRYHYRGLRLPAVAIRLLTSAPWQAFASVRSGGETIAIGRVAAAGGWAGLTAIEVDPRYRRRGLAAAVTAALAAAAARQGAAQLYLQVEDDNVAARTLYRKIRFTDHHGYHYRVAPGS